MAVPAIPIFVAVSALAYAGMQPWRPLWRLVDLDHRPARRLARVLSRIAFVYAADLVAPGNHPAALPAGLDQHAETAIASITIAVLLLELVRAPLDPAPRAATLDVSPTASGKRYRGRRH